MSHPYDWYRFDKDANGLRMIDLTTGFDIDPQFPLSMFQGEPELRDGLRLLSDNADRLRMTNYYGAHGTADDLGNPGTFERAHASHTVFGYESYASSQVVDAHARNTAARNAAAHRPVQTFQDRLFRSVVAAETTLSIPIDLRKDGTLLERQIIDLGNRWNEELTDVDEGRLGAITINNIRDWAMLATLGVTIRQHTGPRLPAELDVGTFAGLDHFDKTRKAHCLGVPAVAVLVRSETIASEELNKPVISVPQSGIFRI
ncbi:MAG TPA: hypothetical protein VLF59_00885 [Candidatus Saccharimonadales bacterium]|nr:hypothetical protein [Candidatus Saccharimonadales bacterium]